MADQHRDWARMEDVTVTFANLRRAHRREGWARMGFGFAMGFLTCYLWLVAR